MKEILILIIVSITFAIGLVEFNFSNIISENKSTMPFTVIAIGIFELVIVFAVIFYSKVLSRPIFEKHLIGDEKPIFNNFASNILLYIVAFQLVLLLIIAESLGGEWEWLYWTLMAVLVVGASIPVVV